MFTGIIQGLGKIIAIDRHATDLSLRIETPNNFLTNVQIGDSIACNGVCLTAVAIAGAAFYADVSGESLEKTTIGEWQTNTVLNLEKALTAQQPLGGHIVSGHVDGVGIIRARQIDGRSERFSIQAPKLLAKYIAAKGSITIDGTSLTVNSVNGDEFSVNIVPHTLEHTIIGAYQPGTRVNLEVDVIARYLERLLEARES